MSIHDFIASDLAVIFGTGEAGTPATYTPAAPGSEPFGVTVVPVMVRNDLGPYVQGSADQREVSIQHSALTAQGLTAPTPRRGNVEGDTLTTADLNGTDEIWMITDADPSEYGTWRLSLQKGERVR